MVKSADAFRTISEVSEWLDTPAHVLRFWESKFSQVKPVKRAGGRRYYRPSDMELLGGIKRLLHEDGMTIKGAQKLLREKGVAHVAALSQPLDDVTAAVRDAMDTRAQKAKEPEQNTVVEETVAPVAEPMDQDAAMPTVTPFRAPPPAGPAMEQASPAPAPATAADIAEQPSLLAALYAKAGAGQRPYAQDLAGIQNQLRVWLASELG